MYHNYEMEIRKIIAYFCDNIYYVMDKKKKTLIRVFNKWIITNTG
jgi:hypothetical protein